MMFVKFIVQYIHVPTLKYVHTLSNVAFQECALQGRTKALDCGIRTECNS